MAKADGPTIIIKKIKKGGGGHAHSAAWKVAYADFVTAMMAFFLLLWLLNVTTDEQKLGIANYFLPTVSSKDEHGSVGFSGGMALDQDGPFNTAPMSRPSLVIGLPSEPEGGEGMGDGDGVDFEDATDMQYNASGVSDREPTPDERLLEAAERVEFQEVEAKLRAAIEADPELAGLDDSLEIARTPDGLRIQILDQEQQSMFPSGSAEMVPAMAKLLEQVAQTIAETSNKVSISGHTDSHPFKSQTGADNWTLSADRANAARRHLIAAGMEPGRVAGVTGKAETEPHDPSDPEAAVNRRISIMLLSAHGSRPLKANGNLTPEPTVDAASQALREWRP